MCRWPNPGLDAKCGSGTVMRVETVKWFNSQKGFGFVQPDNPSRDVFVHINAVERAGMSILQEGQKLFCEVVVDRRTVSLRRRECSVMGSADAPRALTIDVLAKLLVQSPASGLPARGTSAAADCTEWCPKVP